LRNGETTEEGPLLGNPPPGFVSRLGRGLEGDAGSMKVVAQVLAWRR